MIMALAMTIVPQANAALWTGACAVNVRFNFATPVRAVGTAPDYSITVSSVADLDPLNSGTQGCAVTLDPLEIGRSTSVSATGSSVEWSCAAAVASGSWNQQWFDSSGSGSPPAMFGSHTVTGTWGDWVLTLTDASLTTVGVAELTLAPTEATKLAQCPLIGFTSLGMTGTLVFQDP
jgi:hypothetical protein